MAVVRILWKSLCIKPCKLQVVQNLTASDKLLRLQFVRRPEILGHDNFLSSSAFTGEAEFHISECLSQHGCVI